jgi:hypothetical protein
MCVPAGEPAGTPLILIVGGVVVKSCPAIGKPKGGKGAVRERVKSTPVNALENEIL